VRLIHAGLDADGRSLVTRQETLDVTAARIPLFMVPPRAASPPPGPGAALDLKVQPGAVSWLLRRLDPGYSYDMHHTDTVDLHLVLDGSAELILDDGPHQLGPGDAVAITGVDHGWRVGPDGCLFAMLFVGTTRHDVPADGQERPS
jgi:quercetin dioxygenase-like cupin family protein